MTKRLPSRFPMGLPFDRAQKGEANTGTPRFQQGVDLAVVYPEVWTKSMEVDLFE